MPQSAHDMSSTPAAKARIALRADIDKLMDYFLLTESVRYQEFAKVWKALNFALIYVGLTDNRDKKEFILDAFEMVSEYLQPPFDLQRRVCALYTLYGLYYTQTYHPRIKIRMCLEDWKETLALHDDLQEQGHLDALFIFHKMRLDKAFKFTATHCPMHYHGKAKKPEDFERWAAKHQSFMASVLDEELLQELEQVHVGYQTGKQSCGLGEDASLAIVKESMSEYIMERITNIDVPKEADSDEEALEQSRMRSSRIQDIKAKSFLSPAQVSRARRRHGTDDSGTDDPTYDPSSSPSTSKRKQQKKGKLGRPRKSPIRVKTEDSSSPKGSPLKSLSEDAESGSPNTSKEISTPGKAAGLSSSKKKKENKVTPTRSKRKSAANDGKEELTSSHKKKRIKKVTTPNKRKLSATDGEEELASPKKRKRKPNKKNSVLDEPSTQVDTLSTQVDEKSDTKNTNEGEPDLLSSKKFKKKKRKSSKKDSVVEPSAQVNESPDGEAERLSSKKKKLSKSCRKTSVVETSPQVNESVNDKEEKSSKKKKPRSHKKSSDVEQATDVDKAPNKSNSKQSAQSNKGRQSALSRPARKSKASSPENSATENKSKKTVIKTEKVEFSPRKRPRKSSTPRKHISSCDDDANDSNSQRSLRSDRAKKVL